MALFITALPKDESLAEAVSMAWAEGGVGMYAVLLGGGLASVVAALLLFFGVQRASAAVVAIAPIGSALTAIGAGFSYWGMQNLFEALGMVNALDAATIAAAGSGEALQTTGFGMAATAGLLLAAAVGGLLGAAAQADGRKLLLLTTALFGITGAWFAVMLHRTEALAGLLKAMAHVSSLDRPLILAAADEELARFQLPRVALLLLIVAIAVGGAALLRDNPRTAALFALLGFGGLVGAGAQALAQAMTSRDTAEWSSHRPAAVELVTAEGFIAADAPAWCLRDKLLRCEDSRTVSAMEVEDLLQNDRRPEPGLFGTGQEDPLLIAVGIAPDASAKSLWDMLGTFTERGVRGVALTGRGPTSTAPVPRELAVIGALINVTYRGVPVSFIVAGSECIAPDCVVATYSDGTLVVDGKPLAPGSLANGISSLSKQVRVKLPDTLSPTQLMSLSHVASSNDFHLFIDRQ